MHSTERDTDAPTTQDASAWCAHERAEANRARQFLPFAALDGLDELMSEEVAFESEEAAYEAEAEADVRQIVL